MMKNRIEVRGLRTETGCNARRAAGLTRASILSPQSSERGFTLVEMIMVIVITGIIGGIVAVFLQAPMKQYMDVARRADMSDIADTALRRISRDLRLALPNSVRVTGACAGDATSCFLEFLPTQAGGRYCAAAPCDELDFSSALDEKFDVLVAVAGQGIDVASGDSIAIYNLGITGADAYEGTSRRNAAAPFGNVTNITFIPGGTQFPFDSPGHRFHVISTPVSYVCDGTGTVWRYWGYPIQDVHDKTDSIAELNALIPDANHRARLATNVSSCRFTYDANVVAQRSGLVTMHLAIAEEGETITLYNAAHVSNQP